MRDQGEAGTRAAGTLFLVGSLFVPGPEDAFLAYLAAKHGFRFTGDAILNGSKRLLGKEADEAERLVREAAEDFVKANSRASDIAKEAISAQGAGNLLQCARYADDLKSRLIDKGIKGEHILVKSGSDFGVYSKRLDKAITRNGRHEAIRVGYMIYDNLNPKGIPFDSWIDDLDFPRHLEPEFIYTPF